MSQILPSSPQLFMIVGMGMLIFLLWRRSNRHFGRGGTAHQPTHRPSSLAKDRNLALVDAPAEVTRWQVEMYETARDLKGEIDTKLVVLQVLIRQAAAAQAKLDAALAKAQRLGISERLESLSASDQWQSGKEDPALSAAPAPHAHAPHIYSLADDGQSPAMIASATGLPLGEIEMVLSLRPARR